MLTPAHELVVDSSIRTYCARQESLTGGYGCFLRQALPHEAIIAGRLRRPTWSISARLCVYRAALYYSLHRPDCPGVTMRDHMRPEKALG